MNLQCSGSLPSCAISIEDAVTQDRNKGILPSLPKGVIIELCRQQRLDVLWSVLVSRLQHHKMVDHTQ
jgi:hypothetical protein